MADTSNFLMAECSLFKIIGRKRFQNGCPTKHLYHNGSNFLTSYRGNACMHGTQKVCNPFLCMALYVGTEKACPLVSKGLKFM